MIVEPGAGRSRRLAAILAADMVGYSRLMAADEVGTLTRLKALNRDVMDPVIAQHQGEVVKRTGDGFLAVFGSVVSAVEAAAAMQVAVAASDDGGLGAERIQFRMAVNLGDVIVDDGDVFGDGVNVAARLESLAEPGSVVLSDAAYQQVRGKVDHAFSDLGDLSLKNIPQPVRAHKIQLHSHDGGSAAAAMVRDVPLTLPHKPSIAVLPFQNLSHDPEQEYFGLGIAEDIITGLSRNRSLFVIARNSSFALGPGSVDARRVGREFGVRYVLEGSVRRAGSRVRVNAQLVEAETARHVWADHYDGAMEDIFELQDDITTRIIGALVPELTLAEVGRSTLSRSRDLDAWDLYLQALPHYHRITEGDFRDAEGFLLGALELDPDFTSAHALLSECYAFAAYHGWMRSTREAIEKSVAHGERAVSLDRNDPVALAALGWARTLREPKRRVAELFERALVFDPNMAHVWSWLGAAYGFMGRTEEALAAVKHARRGSPRDPHSWHWSLAECLTFFAAERFDECIAAADRVVELQPRWYGSYPPLAAAAALTGRTDRAREAVAALLEIVPRFSMKGAERNPMFETPTAIRNMIDGLRLAGLPEEPR